MRTTRGPSYPQVSTGIQVLALLIPPALGNRQHVLYSRLERFNIVSQNNEANMYLIYQEQLCFPH